MKNKGFLLFIVGLFTMFGIYIFWQDITSMKYTKEFKEELSTYIVDLNNWSEAENQIAIDYNKSVVEESKDNKVRAYDYLEENIITRTQALVKEVELKEVRAKETKEIKEEYLKIIKKQLDLYNQYLASFDKQDEKIFEETKVIYAEFKTERKIFNKKVELLIQEMNLQSIKEKE